uniref:Serine/threonine-protein kinase TOR n=1 Tax=Dermatophagoides pteronyssinus TaxID=6956 RepID=A0A6P6XV50_DERPT|nr:serine/threonine-protein kinase mTOR-like [Dermatophagoides pteronyssinus]
MFGDQNSLNQNSTSFIVTKMLTKHGEKELLIMKNKEHESWIHCFLQEIQQSNSSSSSTTSSSNQSQSLSSSSRDRTLSGSSDSTIRDDFKRKKRAILKLQQHLQQDMSDEQRKQFYDFALTRIFDLMVGVSASNLNDIKSGIMLMCILLDAPTLEKNRPPICAPFANHLRNVNLSSFDLELLDLIACAVGKIALNSGSSTPNFVEFEIRRAIELIGNEKNDLQKRHSAILNLRELANVTPSYFFNHVMHIFENIFIAIYEPKLREPAIAALRSALSVVVQRERLASSISSASSSSSASASTSSTSKSSSTAVRSRIDQQIPMCYELCYNEIIKSFEERDRSAKDRDDRIHAALLILNELIRCSHDSSIIFRDSSINRQLDFLYNNLRELNDLNTFYFSNYLFYDFDYPLSFDLIGQNISSSSSSSKKSQNNSSSNNNTDHLTDWHYGYLTKLFRNYQNLDSSSMPLMYGLRTLQSMVNYHKEMGSAPILSFFHKRKFTKLSTICYQLIQNHFDIICLHLISLLKLKNSIQINQVLLLVLPSLTSLNPKYFSKTGQYVNDSIQYLLICIKNQSLRSLAFISLGLFALSIKDVSENAIDQHLPLMISQIRQFFPAKDHLNQQSTPSSTSKKHRQQSSINNHIVPDPAVFTCLSFIAQAVGRKIRLEIAEMLPSMFVNGLSEPLVNSLYDICKYIPELKSDIHELLLKILSKIIMDRPMIRPKLLTADGGSSQSFLSLSAHSLSHGGGSIDRLIMDSSSSSSSSITMSANDLETLKLALKVLGRFDFKPRYFFMFLPRCANQYLMHENREIRLEAVHTCCQLLKPFLKPNNGFEKMTKDVLQKLLIVGITDQDKFVRYSVLSRLDEYFDYYLAQAINLESLQLTVYDECFEIRELGVCINGRLSSLNPAYVMPFLLRVLLQFLSEFEHSGIAKNLEQSARMLGHLLASAPRFSRPYTEPILKVFLPKLRDPQQSQAVITAVMSAVGELAIVSGLEMRAYFYELFPIILDAVQDTNSFQKREIALWTMGRLIENCGYVIEPYSKFPTLMEVLFSIMKSEPTKSSQLIRRETIRVLGLLGAVDPYCHKINMGFIDLSGESLISYDPALEQEANSYEMIWGTFSSDDFYSSQAINTLIAVMKDPQASSQHTMAVQAMAFIFNVLKVRSVPYLPNILPPFINIIRTGDPKIREFLLQQLGQIISAVKKHIRSYLDDIFKVLRELWTTNNSTMQLTLFNVVDQMVLALGSEFRNYVPHLIPHILKVFNHDASPQKEVTIKLLSALQNFGITLEDYIHLMITPILKLFEIQSLPGSTPIEQKRDSDLRILAIKTIETFCRDLSLKEFAPRIIHSLVKTIDDNPNDKRLFQQAMDTLCRIVFQLDLKFKIYLTLVSKVLQKHKLFHDKYELLADKIQNDITISEMNPDALLLPANLVRKAGVNRRNYESESQQQQQQQPGQTDTKRATLSLEELKHAWNQCSRRISKEDWLDWLRKFNVDLIKESPSLSLRSCFPIAQSCNNVARELFNPAFWSCWNELNSAQKKELVTLLEETMKEQEVPEVTGILLNLAEFLEHIDQGPLLFDVKILSERAMKCRAYAKALHYKEKEFQERPTTENLGALITINNKLQQPQAAYGCLAYALKSTEINDIEIKEKWFEKLHNYESAFIAYKMRYEQNGQDHDALLGQMRCLEVLSEWERLYTLSQQTFNDVSEYYQQRMARMAVTATWSLNQWDEMIEYARYIPTDSFESAFYEAVIRVHQEDFQQAQYFIDKSRELIDTDLTSMAGESYQRAYPAMVQVQMMSELEEVIQYKLVPERQEMIRQKWWQRLQGCQRQIEDWQKILQIHSLVLKPQEDMRAWLKFSKLCEKNHRLDLSFKTIVKLMGTNPTKLIQQNHQLPITYPEVTLKFIEHLWNSGRYKRAYIELQRFCQRLEEENSGVNVAAQLNQNQNHLQQRFNINLQDDSMTNTTTTTTTTTAADILTTNNNDYMYAHIAPDAHMSPEAINKVLSRAYLKRGQWEEFLLDFDHVSIPSILESYKKATQRDLQWYKAWHTWAFMNFRALKFCKELLPEVRKNIDHPLDVLGKYGPRLKPKEFAINAVRGFFQSVAFCRNGSSLQDTLRILTIWFEDGYDDTIRAAVEEGIKSVSIETWLQVIPQLIARIDMPHVPVAKLIHTLLTDIGKYHPQALIYPLTVASKSSNEARSEAANTILVLMRVHSPNLVKQAVLVSEELIRIAILWHELWHEGLEEASRLYFGDKNVDAMFETLEPLHKMIERQPSTRKELTFYQNYGQDLAQAYQLCQNYKITLETKNLTQAWDIYYHVFKRISRQLPQLTSLELEYVSPKLTECSNLELAVPGSYSPHNELIRIAKVETQLNIIISKQRPRKLTIKGSNGHNYMFLLKGHEDLRQDERVMQLFGLVNTLLNSEDATSRQNLAIQRYAVIPLSPNSGLIGWVPCCDTLHSLIRDYRNKRKILLNMEHRLMLRMAPEYDRLALLQKVEVFEHALEHTPGDDLAKILWVRSPSSEVWFDRRTNYTRSLAVMSMVGYILGLGDRHPSNLMLDRNSGKILHIDFGDCFEVAMTREKYPEKIPFRLTRMLIKAMEVTGLDGTFRTTCQQVMMCLRKNKESLMALLEAFVYDPLLNWRLIEAQPKSKTDLNSKKPVVNLTAKDSNNNRHRHHHHPDAHPMKGVMDVVDEESSSNLDQPPQGPSATVLHQADDNQDVGGNDIIHHHPRGHPQRLSSIKRIVSIQNAEQRRLDYYLDEGLNSKAVAVIERVNDKLTGHDFGSSSRVCSVNSQVEQLIKQATNHENLCQCYIGWCPFW